MRLLFITHSRIGDAVLSTGVLAYLLERYREARVTIACGRAPAELFDAVPGLEEIYIIDKQQHARHWIGLWRHVVLRHWDAVVDLRASAIAYLLWTRDRYVAAPSKEPVHRLVHLTRIVGAEGMLEPRIWTRAEHWEEAKALVPDGSPVLAVAPTANWRGKMWRGARFAERVRSQHEPQRWAPCLDNLHHCCGSFRGIPRLMALVLRHHLSSLRGRRIGVLVHDLLALIENPLNGVALLAARGFADKFKNLFKPFDLTFGFVPMFFESCLKLLGLSRLGHIR